MKQELIEKVNNNPQNYVIGFAVNYYTLYKFNHKALSHQNPFSFIQSISKDLNKVMKMFPDVTIDESVHGFISMKDYLYKHGEFDGTFSKGKYNGTKIEENTDIDYMVWYAENFIGTTAEENRTVRNKVVESGLWEWNDELCIFKKIPTKEELSAKTAKIKEITSGNYSFVATRNLDEVGNIKVDGAVFHFQNNQMNYNGFVYSLPILNGKTKRIKGKTIIIKKVKLINAEALCFDVKDFEIIK